MVSITSISRWKLARMARGRRPSACPSVMRRSRSFWYSRMPLAKMRSMGRDSWRSAPARQTGRSGWCRTRTRARSLVQRVHPFQGNSLRKMAAQLATETQQQQHDGLHHEAGAQHQLQRIDRSWFMGGLRKLFRGRDGGWNAAGPCWLVQSSLCDGAFHSSVRMSPCVAAAGWRIASYFDCRAAPPIRWRAAVNQFIVQPRGAR